MNKKKYENPPSFTGNGAFSLVRLTTAVALISGALQCFCGRLAGWLPSAALARAIAGL